MLYNLFVKGGFMGKILLMTQEQEDKVKNYMPDDDTLFRLANFFGIFSDKTRIKIITALCMHDMCVNDLSVLLNINQTTVSHQLKILKQWGAVVPKRDGKIVSYKLVSDGFNELMMDGVNMLF